MMRTVSVPLVITSTGPVSATVVLYFHATSRASDTTSREMSSSEASTPLVLTSRPAINPSSEALPRMTANCTSSSRRETASLRMREAPAPTGSRMTGMSSALATLPAWRMEVTVR